MYDGKVDNKEFNKTDAFVLKFLSLVNELGFTYISLEMNDLNKFAKVFRAELDNISVFDILDGRRLFLKEELNHDFTNFYRYITGVLDGNILHIHQLGNIISVEKSKISMIIDENYLPDFSVEEKCQKFIKLNIEKPRREIFLNKATIRMTNEQFAEAILKANAEANFLLGRKQKDKGENTEGKSYTLKK